MSQVCEKNKISIADCEKNEEIKNLKSKLYRSKYRETIQSAKRSNLNQSATWGGEIQLRAPCNYLKKNEGIRLTKSALHKCIPLERKPKLPDWDSNHQKISVKQEKNFIIKNIKNVINKPKIKIEQKYVDTRKGDSHELRKSGMMPQYVYNKNYGKTPIYLIKRKSYLWEGGDDEQNDDFGFSKFIQVNSKTAKFVDPKERMEISKGLRKNWNELYRAYQGLPICTDTEYKKQRKIKIEDELRKLEKDIYLIESNPIIYVYDSE